MEIVPVLDLLGGVVVHGRAGRRHEYRPVQGVLVEGSEPVAVASALQRVAAAAALYVADLDAIEGTGDNLAALRSVMGSVRAALWVDAGVTTAAAARDLLTAGVSRAVVGTETLPSVERWEALRRDIGDERLLLSLDMRGGVVRSAAPELRGSAPLDALRRLDASTLPALLVLPVDRVGSSGGPDLATLSAVRGRLPEVRLVAGGGVKDAADLHALQEVGADAALVATALHSGSIGAADLTDLSRA